MYCRNCGKELSQNSNFCPYCGETILQNNMPHAAEINRQGLANLEHAGFGKRLLAYLMDAIILSTTGVLLAVVLGQGIESGTGSLVIAWLCFATMESSDRMGTFGKNAIGIKVTIPMVIK